MPKTEPVILTNMCFIQAYKGSVFMVCHEPDFYEGLVDAVWDFNKMA